MSAPLVRMTRFAVPLLLFTMAACGNISRRNDDAEGQDAAADSFPAGLITSGESHSCAVRGGRVYCWGAGSPVAVEGLENAVAVSAGGDHTCALVQGGSVVCWGAGAAGQLGHGNWDSSNTPVRVQGLERALMVAAGATRTCALVEDGSVMCWGSGYGELWEGTVQPSNVPMVVSAVADAKWLSAKGARACVAVGSSGVICWQDALGNLETRSVTIAPEVTSLEGAVSAETGARNTCALRGDKTVGCWGSFAASPERSAPVDVAGLGDVQSITVGGLWGNACVVRDAGSVMCWGWNGFGMLGDGGTEDSGVPVGVLGLDDAASVAAGTYHTCALRRNGGVVCWGMNSNLGGDRIGDPLEYSAVPVPVQGLPDL